MTNSQTCSDGTRFLRVLGDMHPCGLEVGKPRTLSIARCTENWKENSKAT